MFKRKLARTESSLSAVAGVLLSLVLLGAPASQAEHPFGRTSLVLKEQLDIGLPESLAPGDLNGDGFLDLVANDAGAGVHVLLGNGDGTFGEPTELTVWTQGPGMALADLDGDGALDLVAPGGAFFQGVSVLLGNGDGSFALPLVNWADGLDFTSESMAVGDFDGDGVLDVAFETYVSVHILLGNGDGTFGTPAGDCDPIDPTWSCYRGGGWIYGPYPGSYYYRVMASDLDADGADDLVVARGGEPRGIRVFLSNGDGTMGEAHDYPAPYLLGFADLTGDAALDLVGIDEAQVFVMPGNGDGTFAPALGPFGAGERPLSYHLADFTNDGVADLAVAGLEREISVLPSNGDGTFGERRLYTGSLVETPWPLAAADFDLDGNNDFVVGFSRVLEECPTFQILLGNGDGTFGSWAPLSDTGVEVNTPRGLVTADFDLDGVVDLVAAESFGSQVSFLRGLGDGSFAEPAFHPTAERPWALAVADLDQNGAPDLVVGHQVLDLEWPSVTTLLGNGNGTFVEAGARILPGSIEDLVVGDLNGDGFPDTVVSRPGADVHVLLGNGDGTFGEPTELTVWTQGPGMALADLDGDGALDLVAPGGAFFQGVSVLLGNGDGSFALPLVNWADGLDFTSDSMAVGDFDGDGVLDVAFQTGFSVHILLGNGDGTFGTPAGDCDPIDPTWSCYRGGGWIYGPYPGSYYYRVMASDLDADGADDLVVAQAGAPPGFRVFLSNGDGTLRVGDDYEPKALPRLLEDLDGDGEPDLIATYYASVRVLLNDRPPIAVASADVVEGVAPLSVQFDGSGSDDPEGGPLRYWWSFGDGATSRGASPEHVYTEPGNYAATLEVTDFAGNVVSGDAVIQITVGAPAPEIDVAPLALDFGDVGVGSSASLVVTITNLGWVNLVVSGIDFGAGSSPDFSVTASPTLPATLPLGGTADVEVTFTPSAEGVANATLEIESNDADEPVVAVALNGTGVSVEPPPEEQIQAILDAFDAAVATGDLSGDGPNARSAAGRRGALRNMLLASGDLIRDGLVAEACQQLLDALKRMDGEFPPPDFVAGGAADDIAALIFNLRGSLGCSGE